MQLLIGPSLFMAYSKTRYCTNTKVSERKHSSEMTCHNGTLAPRPCLSVVRPNLTLTPGERSIRKQAAAPLCASFTVLVWLKRKKTSKHSKKVCPKKKKEKKKMLHRQTKLLLRLCCIWAYKVRLEINAPIKLLQRVTVPCKEMNTLLRVWHVKRWGYISQYVQIRTLHNDKHFKKKKKALVCIQWVQKTSSWWVVFKQLSN